MPTKGCASGPVGSVRVGIGTMAEGKASRSQHGKEQILVLLLPNHKTLGKRPNFFPPQYCHLLKGDKNGTYFREILWGFIKVCRKLSAVPVTE